MEKLPYDVDALEVTRQHHSISIMSICPVLSCHISMPWAV
jgi:hypothetical protein